MSKFEYYPLICDILPSISFNSQIVQGFHKMLYPLYFFESNCENSISFKKITNEKMKSTANIFPRG